MKTCLNPQPENQKILTLCLLCFALLEGPKAHKLFQAFAFASGMISLQDFVYSACDHFFGRGLIWCFGRRGSAF
jgi:hypothetical protein